MHKLIADAVHDYGVSVQGKAIFELARQHIKKAIKTELINSGHYKLPFRTYYADCEDDVGGLRKFNVSPALSINLKGTRVIFASTDDFIKGTAYETFVVAFCFYDPDTAKRVNRWDGFFSQQGISYHPTIFLYCPYDPPNRVQGFIQVKDVAERLVSALNVRTQELKSTFVHEFGHNYNFLQWVDKQDQINKRVGEGKKQKPRIPTVKYQSPPNKYDTPEDLEQYRRYVNDPQEVNARYLEWIHAVQVSFNRLLRVKDNDFDIRRAFKTFADFWDFYYETPGFLPEALEKWATLKTKKKLARRFYGYYMFLVENPGVDAREAEAFAAKQMQKDTV